MLSTSEDPQECASSQLAHLPPSNVSLEEGKRPTKRLPPGKEALLKECSFQNFEREGEGPSAIVKGKFASAGAIQCSDEFCKFGSFSPTELWESKSPFRGPSDPC